MSRKLLNDVSASTLQVILNHVLGVVVFLLISLYLPKEVYGELNWSYAVMMFVIATLSLRLEQIVVRRAATTQDASAIMTLFMVHVLLSGLGFYLLLLLASLVFPSFFTVHSFLLALGISQLLTFFALPFKNVANGREKFGYLAVMSSTANLVRAISLFIIIIFFHLTIQWVLAIFIITAFIELLVCFYLVTSRMQIKLAKHVRFAEYRQLLKESLPQISAAVLMAGIARIDWILLGFFSTTALTAEYSFAYRVFELSPLPLLIIAPVLLSRFSRYFATHTEQSLLQQRDRLSLLVRCEMIVATMIPLILNIIWTPFFDYLTGDKYGAVNQKTFMILSCCIPFQYISNIIWSANFAQNHLKLILRITIVTFCIILAGDLVFIPLHGPTGAALVYLAATIVEYINYMRTSSLSRIRETWRSLLICVLAASGTGWVAFYLFDDVYLRLGFAIPVFSFILVATRQLRVTDITYVLQSIKKKKT